jgi:hypothetical protein
MRFTTWPSPVMSRTCAKQQQEKQRWQDDLGAQVVGERVVL